MSEICWQAQEAPVTLSGEDLTVLADSREILSHVSLSISPGELVAVIGPNGAGKSTLLGALSGDLPLHSGASSLGGTPMSHLGVRRRAQLRAVLPQHHEVAFDYLVHDVVLLGRTPWPADPDLDEEIVTWALECCEVSHLADRSVTTLSGGELARVQLARVLAQRTGIILLDEPTAALDVAHQEAVLKVAATLTRLPQGQARGVLAVLHDLSLAAAWCDRLVLMKDGVIVEQGSAWEVCREDLLTSVYGWPLRVSEDPDNGAPLITPVRSR